MTDIQIKRGSRSLLPPNLKDGEMYLIKDEDILSIKNGEKLVELSTKEKVVKIEQSVNSITETIGVLGDNISSLNNEIDTKVTIPDGGKQNQILVKKDNTSNEMIWKDMGNGGSGNKITLSVEEPQNPGTGDIWFKPI